MGVGGEGVGGKQAVREVWGIQWLAIDQPWPLLAGRWPAISAHGQPLANHGRYWLAFGQPLGLFNLYDLLDALDLVYELHLCHSSDVLELLD